MPEIFPAILTDNSQVYERQLRLAEQFAPCIQIDITDGKFVPTRSIRAVDIAAARPTIPFEIHLMVDRPEEIVHDFLALNPVRVIVHRSSTKDGEALFSAIQKSGCEAAVAVSPTTLSLDLGPYLGYVQQVTFVSVDPGFQGGALIPGVLHKAKRFHEEHPQIPMEIDGGIKLTNLQQAMQTRADRYVIGSGLWGTEDPAATYREIVAAAEKFFSQPHS